MAVVLATVPFAAHAAGMGRLNVLSGLGQPLHAEIDLVAVQSAEAESLRAALAAPEAFREAQIEYPSTTLGLRFNLEKRANGQYFIAVNSAGSINEPFLDFLVELKWDGGRVLREYTALLDPVGYNPAGTAAPTVRPVAPAQPAPKPAAAPAAVVAAPAPVAKPTEPVAPKKSETRQPREVSESGDGYTVKPGDTLAQIARQHKPDGVSLEQMLVSLYQANQDAFDGNMNRLKRGKILTLPAKGDISVSQHDAVQEIHAQAEDWRAYRAKLAGSTTSSQQPAAKDAGSGKITAKVEDKATPPQAAKSDKLTLSKGDEAGKLKERVHSLEEDTTAKQKALDEANQRVSDLEKTNKKLEELLALKTKQGAQLQKQAEAAKAVEPAKVDAKPAPEAAKPVVQKPVESKAAEAKTPEVKPADAKPAATPADAKPVEPVKPADAKPAESAQPPVDAPKPKPKKKPVIIPQPEPEPSLFDDPLVTYGGGLLALLGLGGAGYWYSRRRKKSTFEDSIITGSDLKSNTMVGNTGGAVISTGVTENSFLTDFSRAGLGSIDTDEVDPIAEAEVYMAYGRDAQAEEILKDALARDGSRQEVRLKLLEIYSARKSVAAFEALAQELYAATQGQGALWQQAAEMGRVLDPQNSLYQHQEPVNTDALDQTMVMAAGTLNATGQFDQPFVATSSNAAVEDIGGDLDFQLDVAQPAPEQAAEAASLDFDLDVGGDVADLPVLDAAPAAAAAPDLEAEAELGAGLDMDFDLGDLAEAAPAIADVQVSQPDESGILSLDIPLDLAPEAAPLDAPVADTGLMSLDLDMPVSGDDAGQTVVLDALPAEAPSASTDVALNELDSPDLAAGLDFDFDVNDHVEVVAAAANTPVLDFDNVNLDLDIAPEASSGDVIDFGAELDDPVTTKIDLARAYIDMGDKEGAREILHEALSEGSDEQKSTAESLLAQL
jgi:pilus assembly protein FimV